MFFWLALAEDESRTLFWTYRMILDLFCRYKRSAAYACSLHQMFFCELPSKMGDVVECSGFLGVATVLACSQTTHWIFRPSNHGCNPAGSPHPLGVFIIFSSWWIVKCYIFIFYFLLLHTNHKLLPLKEMLFSKGPRCRIVLRFASK